MTFVVGDIHGEISKLKQLISIIQGIDYSAEFVFIGDYLDKGENVLNTLDFLSDLSVNNKCIFLLGNHEYLWMKLHSKDIEAEQYLLKYGGLMTIKSFGASGIYEAYDKLMKQFSFFIKQLLPHYLIDNYLIVHSGIRPEDYMQEVSNIDLINKLFNRYRFIQYDRLYLSKYKIIFGHTGFFQPYIDPYKIGVDTAACFLESQPLTAFCIEEEFFIDSFEKLIYLKEFKMNQVPLIPRNKPWRNYD